MDNFREVAHRGLHFEVHPLFESEVGAARVLGVKNGPAFGDGSAVGTLPVSRVVSPTARFEVTAAGEE